MDGKQARRTGSSSALGQLFDHGCDAVNACIIPICFGSVIASGWTVAIFLCLWSGFVPFYFQTWEEYHTGQLILPFFNGPSEGLLIAVAICMISTIYGSGWWHVPIASLDILGYNLLVTPYQGILTFVVVGGTITLIAQTITTSIACARKGKSVPEALIALLPFLVFFPGSFCWILMSKVAFQKVPLLSLLLMSSVFVEMVTHLIVMHITKSKLRPFQRFMVLFIVILLANIVWDPARPPLDEELLITVFAVTSFIFTTIKTFMVGRLDRLFLIVTFYIYSPSTFFRIKYNRFMPTWRMCSTSTYSL
jgi:ethanolaminephosphotransferase